ncbi:MAG: hypothetical protein KGQ60_01330 [Planctomycetes bacterium]|nr:hypothetical protein [Planctomycetota bacterium]
MDQPRLRVRSAPSRHPFPSDNLSQDETVRRSVSSTRFATTPSDAGLQTWTGYFSGGHVNFLGMLGRDIVREFMECDSFFLFKTLDHVSEKK